MKPGKSIFREAIALALLMTAAICFPDIVSADIQNLSSSPGRITFEIHTGEVILEPAGKGTVRILIDRYGTFSPPGAPELPGRIFNIAVPGEGECSVSAVILSRERLAGAVPARKMGSRLRRGEDGNPVTETYLPADPWEGKDLPPVVSAGRRSLMGRVYVIPVRVNPVGRDEEGYWVARRIRVSVSCSAVRPASRTTLPSGWKRIYEKVLVNPGDAAGYIREPVPMKDMMRGTSNGGRSLRIRIPETGFYVLRADSVNSVLGGGPLSAGQFALRRYYYDEAEAGLYRVRDLPVAVIKGESSSAGYFEEDDLLYFYAEGIRDDAAAGDTIAAFTGDHVVWLEEDQFGTVMTDGSGMEPAGEPADSTFISVERIRRDTFYKKKIGYGSRDYYFAALPGPSSVSSKFYCRDIFPGGGFSVSVSLRGYYETDDKNLTFRIQNSKGTYDIGAGTLLGESVKTFSFGSLPAGWLAEGENTLVISDESAPYPVLINHFSVAYPRMLKLADGMLEFSFETVRDSIRVAGFKDAAGYLAEVSGGSGHEIYELDPGMFTPSGSDYTLTIKTQAGFSGRFVLFEKGAGEDIFNRWITLDNSSDIKGKAGPYNTLVISHGDFLPPETDAVSEYVSWREQQGYSILLVDVQDVYDEFNGGLPSCSAIKRFIKYGYDHWGVEFVMLVGDASEDHKQLYTGSSGSPPDFVPSYTYAMRMDAVGYDDEVIATDKWYAYLDDALPFGSSPAEPAIDAVKGTASDIMMPAAPYPDVFLSRVPVGDQIEASRVFLKMRRYEEETAGGEWRRNLILFADDAWSGGTSSYYYHPSEENFAGSMESIAQQLESYYPGGINIQKLYLSNWTDGIQTGGSPPENRSIAIDSTREYFTPYLIDRLNDGALFFAFQGHASRVNMTTESAFSMFTRYSDVGELFSNRNHIYIGMGCHISEFAYLKELGQAAFAGPGGDCLTEQLMLRSGAGAVGSYASSAYEDLIKNNRMCETLFEVIYTAPPSDSIPPAYQETGARWILGELFTEAEIEHINTRIYGAEQSFRHVLFGDPMMNIYPGPPMMKVQADWGEGYEELEADTLVSGSSDNICNLRFTANDLTALGGIELAVNGEDWTDSLEITPVKDGSLTYARGYRADLNDYALSSDERELQFSVISSEGEVLAGKTVYLRETEIRLFYLNNGQEVEISGNADLLEGGEFRVEASFPIYLQNPPHLLLDGSEISNLVMAPQPGDSTVWEGSFSRVFSPGGHTLTASSGDFSASLQFTIGAGEFTFDTFCFPNPFTAGTNIFFTLARNAGRGRISIYNVSGILIRELKIPPDRLYPSPYDDPGYIYWDGTDMAGNRVANGTYIYLLEISVPGETVNLKGKIVKLE